MARRSRRLLVTGAVSPTDMAATVVGNYVARARAELPAWANRYREGVTFYLGQTRRQEEARTKLANWYTIYLSEVYPRLSALFAEAKSAYYRRVIPGAPAAPRPVAPGPGV